MQSMTGFGRASFAVGGAPHRIELRSLNNRFLDVRVRLPWGDSSLEHRVVAAVRQKLARGRVDVAVRQDGPGNETPAAITINRAFAGQLATALQELSGLVGCDIEAATRLVGVRSELLRVGAVDVAPDAIWNDTGDGLRSGLESALQQLIEMRSREGRALQRDLQQHLEKLCSLTETITSLAADEPEQTRVRLQARLEPLLNRETPIDPTRLAQEVALLADRSDVSEEIARLRSHADQLREMLVQRDPVGRKVEFMLQEINRELNTVAAKSATAESSRVVVEAKGLMEKMREQTQNVE